MPTQQQIRVWDKLLGFDSAWTRSTQERQPIIRVDAVEQCCVATAEKLMDGPWLADLMGDIYLHEFDARNAHLNREVWFSLRTSLHPESFQEL